MDIHTHMKKMESHMWINFTNMWIDCVYNLTDSVSLFVRYIYIYIYIYQQNPIYNKNIT